MDGWVDGCAGWLESVILLLKEQLSIRVQWPTRSWPRLRRSRKTTIFILFSNITKAVCGCLTLFSTEVKWLRMSYCPMAAVKYRCLGGNQRYDLSIWLVVASVNDSPRYVYKCSCNNSWITPTRKTTKEKYSRSNRARNHNNNNNNNSSNN